MQRIKHSRYMLTLTLFRHAKSSWDHPGLDDFSRPLSERGSNAAPMMARYAADQCWTPDLILCSAAQRTRQTLELALPLFEPAPVIQHDDKLYLASASELLARVRTLSSATALKTKFPTAAMARLAFEATEWSKVNNRSGRLIAFVTPSFLRMRRASF